MSPQSQKQCLSSPSLKLPAPTRPEPKAKCHVHFTDCVGLVAEHGKINFVFSKAQIVLSDLTRPHPRWWSISGIARTCPSSRIRSQFSIPRNPKPKTLKHKPFRKCWWTTLSDLQSQDPILRHCSGNPEGHQNQVHS